MVSASNKSPHNAFLAGKTILITGGTGTFGQAMTRYLLAMPKVKKVIIFSRDEYKQYQMAREFKNDPRLSFFLGDVRDRNRLHRAFNGVDIIIHAAALKQVPAIEYNPTEAIETNIVGTKNVVEIAHDRDVARVLLASSDKAVHPVNLYGASKLCAERLCIAGNAYRGKGRTAISAVRYGNVIGSRGSLVELIEKQKETRGRLTLTDERMTRFWLHIDDVMKLVTEMLGIMEGGEIFIPKMESLKIIDVMQVLAPGFEIDLIGIRPGEKLHEALITEHEAVRTRDIGSMFVILPEFRTWPSKKAFDKKKLFPQDTVYISNHPAYLRSREHVKRILKV